LFFKKIFQESVQYYDTSLIALILSIITIPSLWYISHGNLMWVSSCTILWGLGVFIIFHPIMRLIFPLLLTNIAIFFLTFILAVVSIGLNIVLIGSLLPNEDIEIIMNRTLFSSSIGTIIVFMWFYILMAETLISDIKLQVNALAQRVTSSRILSLPQHFIEMLLIFIIPIAFLFWTEITYSFRVLLSAISVSIGLSLFIHRLIDHTILQKVVVTTLSLVAIFAINSTVINLFGIKRIPAQYTKARMDGDNILLNLQAKNIENPSFQLSGNEQNNQLTVYQIFASIPQIGLHLGHKVANLPNKEITIKSSKAQYTVHDQYNNQLLLTLDR